MRQRVVWSRLKRNIWTFSWHHCSIHKCIKIKRRWIEFIACDRGKYGSECNNTCGHCFDEDQCSNIRGTCLTGCDDRYLGSLCKTSKKMLYNHCIYIYTHCVCVCVCAFAEPRYSLHVLGYTRATYYIFKTHYTNPSSEF